MSNKDFLKMTPKQRDAEAKKWERGISFDETRPLSKRSRALWENAKRGRGRPRKPATERARRILISLDPNVFALVEEFASSKGLDRSKLFAVSVQAFIAAEKAIEQAALGNIRAAPPRVAAGRLENVVVRNLDEWEEHLEDPTDRMRGGPINRRDKRYGKPRKFWRWADDAKKDEMFRRTGREIPHDDVERWYEEWKNRGKPDGWGRQESKPTV